MSKGQKIDTLAPAEEAKWRKTVAPIVDEWVKNTPDGAKVLAAFREEVEKVRGKK